MLKILFSFKNLGYYMTKILIYIIFFTSAISNCSETSKQNNATELYYRTLITIGFKNNRFEKFEYSFDHNSDFTIRDLEKKLLNDFKGVKSFKEIKGKYKGKLINLSKDFKFIWLDTWIQDNIRTKAILALEG
jgi:hypothetical protein